jgi:IS5 family transposase
VGSARLRYHFGKSARNLGIAEHRKPLYPEVKGPHTLRDVIEDIQKLPGCAIERGYFDKGYRGHDTENPRRIFISGQKRGVFRVINPELRRRSAIEPVVGHLKAEGHRGRCYPKGRAGDAANATLSTFGYNFRRIFAWLRALLRRFLGAIQVSFLTADY